LSTGPSHSAAVSVKNQLFTWGYKHSGRLGLDVEECQRARREPIKVGYLVETLQNAK
jgi:alpha-tubulin suppressor-like RCC1 family protein